MSGTKSWQEMWDWTTELLRRKTGEGLDEWNTRVRDTGIDNEADLRDWLKRQGVEGYSQMLLVMERFGYPEFLTASAEDLIDAQYAGREALRPVFDRVIALGTGLGAGVQARKTYVTLTTERRKFAVVKATTRTRVDLGLRLDGQGPEGRLESAKVLADSAMTVRIPLTAVEQVDDEVGAWLSRAYESNR